MRISINGHLDSVDDYPIVLVRGIEEKDKEILEKTQKALAQPSFLVLPIALNKDFEYTLTDGDLINASRYLSHKGEVLQNILLANGWKDLGNNEWES